MLGMDLGRGGRPLRIAYGRIFHEACADSPLLTTRADFERQHRVTGDELARGASLRGAELAAFFPHAELTGFLQAARAAGGVETVPLASSLAVPGGPLTRECFDWLVDDLVERVRGAGTLDGVYLALHGSREVADLGEPPEAVILRRGREAAPGAKVAASFDLHGNLSSGIVEPLDVLISYRTNPHWDLAPSGFRAGNRLIRALRGRYRPTHAWRKLPVVVGGGLNLDFVEPMRGIYRAMRAHERDPRVVSTSLFIVHPFTSADDLGWAVHVTTDGDPDLAARVADDLADRAWRARKAPLPELLDVGRALDQARASRWRKLGPITLVDVDDIVGAGAPGGNTRVIETLLADDRGLTALVPVHDPAATALAYGAPLGATLELSLRGTPGYGQPEVPLVATVAAKHDDGMFGRRVRLTVGRTEIAVTERPPLPIHPSFWRELGVEPRRVDVMVQKNFFHYRIFHLTTSFSHLPTVSDGATNLRRAATRQRRVPSYPSADPVDWRPGERALRGGDGG